MIRIYAEQFHRGAYATGSRRFQEDVEALDVLPSKDRVLRGFRVESFIPGTTTMDGGAVLPGHALGVVAPTSGPSLGLSVMARPFPLAKCTALVALDSARCLGVVAEMAEGSSASLNAGREDIRRDERHRRNNRHEQCGLQLPS